MILAGDNYSPLQARYAASRSLQIRRVGSTAGALAGILVLVAYAADLQPLDWFLPELPGARPYTAACLTLLGIALQPRSGNALGRFAVRAAGVACFVLLLARLSLEIPGGVIQSLAPSIAVEKSRAGLAIGINPACALLLIAGGEILRRARWPAASQLLAAGALALAFLALAGYVAGIGAFRGAMAPATFLGVVALATALLFASPRRGFMRALTAHSRSGRLVRVILAGSTVLLLIVVRFVSGRIDQPGVALPADGALLVYEIAVVIALTWFIVMTLAMRAHHLDDLRKRAEERLRRATGEDALTGLMTRDSLMRLGGTRDRKQPSAASLVVDLDRFRSVNEALGPEEGDRVILEVARRLRIVGGSNAVARLGGDEFALHCVGMDAQEAARLGAAVVAVLKRPFDAGGRRFRLTASVGVAHQEACQGMDSRQAAGGAMRVAKDRGGDRAVVFTADMHESRRKLVELEQDLYDALQRDDELGLVYQPVVAIGSGKVCAVEALARWNHPRLGPVAPDRFIQLAESTGLMADLGSKLMGIAVHQAAELSSGCAGELPVVNINVSATQFTATDVVGDLFSMVRRHGMQPRQFGLEVTEGVFAGKDAVCSLEAARSAGFLVAMDDFGVGYSSLAQLPRLPLNSLKLDRGFIENATRNAADAALLTSMIELGHALHLGVVAEGVESQEQYDLLARCGCDAVQGYLIARPMRLEVLKCWLQAFPASARAGPPKLT